MDDSGYFSQCIMTEIIPNNKCIHSDEASERGIKGCSYWQTNIEVNGISSKHCKIWIFSYN